MNQQKTPRSRVAWIALLALLAGGPLAAQVTIEQGIDAFTTVSGTQSTVNLPAGFFCPNSAGVSTTVKFTGSPLATIPPGALGTADTVVERLKDATLFPGSCATVPVVVRALELVATDTITVSCPNGTSEWVAEACTCGWCGVQPITEITICDDGTGCGCGNFFGDLQLDVCIKFRNTADGTVVGPVQQRIALTVNTPWCDKNPGGVLEFSDALLVDSDCDEQADLAVACTTNFFPGATCGGGGGCQCPPPICHDNPAGGHQHCVQPPCPCNPHEQPVEPAPDALGP